MDVQDLIRENIKTMKPYASARDEFQGGEIDLVFLDANENPFNNGVNRYPDSKQNGLKSMLSNIKGIPVENILLGNGSDEVLDLIFRVFCVPNRDSVIVLPPTYGMYEVLAETNAINVVKVLLDSDFEPQVEAILESCNNNVKLLFLCSPNNPTANNYNKIKIEKLLREFNGIVIIDEAYIDFSSNETWLKRLSEFPKLIVIQTLSKAYGMAGVRLGACYASEEIISILNKIKLPYNVNQLTQERALLRLQDSENVNAEIEIIKWQRNFLVSALNNISFIKKIYPSSTNFILIKVDNANERYQQLIEKGCVVRNRTNQELCLNCLRLTVGTPSENLKLINALKTL